MEYKKLTCVLFTLVWYSLTLTIRAASPICNTVPSGVFDYGQTCSSSSQCVTGLCFGSRCACDSGTTYSTCAVACVANCNTTITATKGTITNPSYPSSDSISQCFWSIQGATGNIIEFNITYMDMGTVYDCSSNYLELFDGPSSSYRTFGKMCRSWQVLTVSTTSNMFVVFRTSASGRFHATFKIQGSSTTLQEASGYIVSPGYPLSYLENKVYNWTIIGSTGTYVYLNIHTFELQGTFPECSNDYLQVYDGNSTSSPPYPKYCGQSAPGIIASTSNNMHIVFRTDGSAQYKGFNISFYTQGGLATLYESGKIASPGYPLKYLNNQDFTWTLATITKLYLILNISFVETEGCSTDYITVYDGSNTSARTFDRVCGTGTSTVIASSTNYLMVNFRTDGSVTFKGFYAEFYSQEGYSYMDGPSGLIVSPGFPLSYRNNQFITWSINTAYETFIVLNVTSFDLGPSSVCLYDDYLYIIDYNDLIAELCGNVTSELIASTSNYMNIYFITDSYATYKGFNATYYTKNMLILNAPSGSIDSPAYLNNQNYVWKIEADVNTFIVFRLSSIDLGPDSTVCSNDYLKIIEGTENYPSIELARLCGNVVPGLIASASNYMYIVFRTDSSGTYTGFNATYYTKHISIISAPSGSIVSPVNLNDQNNIWKITVDVNSFIILNIKYIDFGPVSTTCSNGSLQIFDGASSRSDQLAALCGNVVPGLIASTSNYMYIVFRTESSYTQGGFRASYITQNTSTTFTSLTGYIVSPGFPKYFPLNEVYSWTIQGYTGTFVVLNITILKLSDSPTPCSNHHIQIYDGQSTSAVSLGRYCYSSSPVYVVSSSNYMQVVFRTNYSSTYQGFYSNYYTQGTSNVLSGTKRFIISPGFPIAYPNNINITWRIDGELGTFIVLNITSFDLGPVTTTCSNDYLQVFDGSSTSSRQLATLCGNVVPGLIASTSNYMYIVFRTDSYNTFRGFDASYFTQNTQTTLTAATGYITSPGFPRSFLTNKVYSWTINGNSRTFIVLNITTLKLSDSSTPCSNHHIQVYDGQSTSGVSLGRYCYSSSPVYVVSSSNYMHVVFRTDNTTTYQGFYSNYYTQACMNTLYGPSGVITSSNYPNGYSKSSTCTWTVLGDSGTRIFLNITDFDVSPCESAFVVAYDGQNTRDNLNFSRCGEVPHFSTTSSSNFVFIAFITSGLINYVYYRGFKLNYVIKDLSYGRTCTLVDQCRSYLTCVSGYCSCPSDKYHNSSTLSCHNKLSFKGKCQGTDQCQNTLQCLNGMCSCDRGFYYSPSDDKCSTSLDYTSDCNSSIPDMCKPTNLDCLLDVNGNQRCLCIDSFHFENNVCVSSSKFNVQYPQMKSKNTTGVELQWEATTPGPNRTYSVSWVSASDETDRGTQAANESGVTVTGLTPGTSYTITVYTFLQQQGFYAARNVSTTVNVVTMAARPGLVNPQLSQLDKPPYIIRFQPSEGRVDHYKFSLESKLQKLNFIVTSPEVKLSDLHADTEYNYSIKAVNSVRDESNEIEGSFKTTKLDVSDDLNIGMIAGATVGSLVFVILLVLVVTVIYRRKVKSNKEPKPKTSKFTDYVSAFTISSPQANSYSRPPSANPDHVYDDVQRLSVDGPQSQDTEHENLQSATIKRPATYTDMTAAKAQQSSTNTDENEHVYANVALPL